MTTYEDKTPDNTPLVKIWWYDIVFDDDGNTNIVSRVTAGWLLEDAETYIKLASTYCGEEKMWQTEHSFPKIAPRIEPVSGRDAAMMPVTGEGKDIMVPG